MIQRYLLDTNIVSELRKPRPHGGGVAWLQSLDEAQLYVSAVTLGEIQSIQPDRPRLVGRLALG